jgi:very-short-patch-repair endonuclease
MAAQRRARTYRARQLRGRETAAERLLWELLRGRGLAGLKFRRQHPLGPFVVDFFSEELGLVVEIDGESHRGREEYDDRRSAVLEAAGLVVLRFSNEEVLGHPRRVLRRIAMTAEKLVKS